MDVKIDPIDEADELSNSLDYLRILLNAAQDKVQFYLTNRGLSGSCDGLLSLQARELDDLLFLMGKFLKKMERQVDTVTDLLYSAEPQGSGN